MQTPELSQPLRVGRADLRFTQDGREADVNSSKNDIAFLGEMRLGGGYLFTLADTAFAFACNAYGQVTVAAGASIDFLRPVQVGDRLEAVACEQHRGRRRGIYDVVVRDQEGRKVAVFRGRAHATDRALSGSE